MNYYEIYKNGLKLFIKTDIINLGQKMHKYFSGCFVVKDYEPRNISNEIVMLDIFKNDWLKKFKDNCFVMHPNTYICSDKKNRIIFIYDKFDENQCLNLKRIIIDIFAKYYESLGTYFVHAAAVVNKLTNKATVFIGESGSGKTTNLLFYLLSGQYDYMGNDRIGIRYSNGNLIINGFPSNLGLRYPTLEMSSALKNAILPYIDKENYLELVNNNLNSKKFNLKVYDLLKALNCRLITETTLSEFIVTCYDNLIYEGSFYKISNEELLKKIKQYHISSISKEQYFLNYLLEFKNTQNDLAVFNSDILAYKSNLHPNCNKMLVKKFESGNL